MQRLALIVLPQVHHHVHKMASNSTSQIASVRPACDQPSEHRTDRRFHSVHHHWSISEKHASLRGVSK
eukprot:2097224-Amphidinium_carterae.1